MKKLINIIKCKLNFHDYEIIYYIIPYKKQCKKCYKKLEHIGYGFWIDADKEQDKWFRNLY